MKFPDKARRIVLGPVMRWAHNPESPAKAADENELPLFLRVLHVCEFRGGF